MKVALVQPRVCEEQAFPLGLASLVPGLRAVGAEVEGLDLGSLDLEEAAARARGTDVVGVTVMTRTVDQVADLVRALGPGAAPPVVLGGPHATLFPRRALGETGATAVVRGDGEEALPRVVRALLEGRRPSIPGVLWRECGRDDPLPPPQRVDLEAAPFADREVFDWTRYSLAMRTVDSPYAVLVGSRGCRRACPYCPTPRLRPGGFDSPSPERVYREMAWLAELPGLRSLHFEDDDPIADRGRFEALCQLLIDRPLPLSWELVNGIPPSRLDADLLVQMARAGCRGLVLSVEALHSRGPSGDAVGYAMAQVAPVVRAARAVGITVGGYFMLGLPGGDLRNALRTIRLSWQLGLERANYTPYEWLAGSAHWDHRRTLEPSSVSPENLERLATLATAGFYLQPAPALALLREVGRQPGLLRPIAAKIRARLPGA